MTPRQAALAAGEKFYFTGQPCLRGHIAQRWVSTYACYECYKKAQRDFVIKNPSKPREYTKKWREVEANRLHNIQYAKTWIKNHPDRARATSRTTQARRHARKVAAGGFFTKTDVAQLFRHQRGLCTYCETDLHAGFHVDHIIPVAKGGSSWPANIQLVCAPCSHRKSARTHAEFLSVLERAKNAMADEKLELAVDDDEPDIDEAFERLRWSKLETEIWFGQHAEYMMSQAA